MTGRTRKPGLQGSNAQRLGRRPAADTTPDAATASSTDAPPAPPRLGVVSALSAVADPEPADGGGLTVDVAALAPHPENAREDVGDVSGLAASIAERGVLQPLVVVSRAAFTVARPDVDLDDSAEWVIIAGHRRHAAAQLAVVPTVPVIVRDELAADEDAVVSMLIENLQREDLTPMEQARAFGRLRDLGWSERRIAADTGVSPGQVHKRLSLLRLPRDVVDALDAEHLTVTDALRLLDLPDDEIAAAWTEADRNIRHGWPEGIKSAVQKRLAAAEGRAVAERLRAQLRDAGVTLIDDPIARFGSDHDANRHRVVEMRDILDLPEVPEGAVAHVYSRANFGYATIYHSELPAPIPAVGVLDELGRPAGAPAPRVPDSVTVPAYARTAPPQPAPADSGPADDEAAREQQRRREERDVEARHRREVADARAAACQRLVTGELNAELAGEILADTLLVDHAIDPTEFFDQAAAWCDVDLADYEDQLAPETLAAFDDDAAAAWIAAEAAATRLRARRAAVAVALAEVEDLITNEHTWTDPGTTGRRARAWRHVQRLVTHAGYELTDVDRRLDPHAQSADDADDAAQDAAPGASAGSTPDPGGSS